MNEPSIRDLFATEPFDDAFRHFMRPWVTRSNLQAPQIKVDLSETDAEYKLKADIPGVTKDQIDIRIDGNKLTLSTEVKKESEEKKEGRVIRSERHYGYASRSFWLECPVDESRAVAQYKDGVLELTLPKSAASTSRRLPIS